jgi:hypothetical protein
MPTKEIATWEPTRVIPGEVLGLQDGPLPLSAGRIVVVADNCDDDTAKIARRYRGVTVMETTGNTDKKVGALIQGWCRYQAGYDFIAGVDADTILDPRCPEQLEYGLVDQPSAGGIMAKYTFDQRMGVSAGARMLIRMQRLEFASWTMDALRKRKTYVESAPEVGPGHGAAADFDRRQSLDDNPVAPAALAAEQRG